MTNQHTNELQCLAWIEGELDQEACRVFEEELQRDPALASRVQAMRRDRELLRSMPETPAPADLLARVERAMARPMLTDAQSGTPGRFRQRVRQSTSHRNWRVQIRVAAMFVVGVGLLAVLLFFNPISRVLTDLNDENMSANGSDMSDFMIMDAPGISQGRFDEPMVYEGMQVVVVTPEPLAMILRSDSDVLPQLSRLVEQVGGSLIHNASREDLKQDDFTASASGTGRSSSQRPPSPVLSGDGAMSPSFDDQFRYAGAGSIYTVSVPLSRLDELLVVLDGSFGADGVILLLEDHLSETGDGDWVQTLRAREAVSTWTRGDTDPIVVLPVFLP